MKPLLILLCFLTVATTSVKTSAADLGRSHFVTTKDGVRLHTLVSGEGASLLFVPGWTMPAEVWRHQVTHFSKSHRVVAMDPRSQGQSGITTEGHYPAARARDIKAVIDELQLAPVVLIGWSLAVTELVSFVDQFGTSNLAALVLVDGNAGIDLKSDLAVGMLKFAGELQKRRQELTGPIIRSMFRVNPDDEFIHQVTVASLKTPTSVALALFLGGLTTDNRPILQKLDKPTLVAVTGDEPWITVYRDLAGRIPNARMRIYEKAGHALFADEPKRFNRDLEDFLTSVPPLH
ncbi:MAG: alpha/beta hydrolase [Verrucomicrobiota bacterium]